MISAKINFDKIDTSRLFEGKKGRYFDIILIETPNSPYSDYMVKQSVTKEEREQGIDIDLGNGKVFKKQDPTNFNSPPDATIDGPLEYDPNLGY